MAIPLQIADVIQHGARRIGRVGDMHFTVGHFPNQPGVDGAEQQLAAFRFFPRPFHIIEDPFHLGAREIGIQQQAGVFPHVVIQTALFQLFTDRSSTAALPDNGVIHGLTGGLFPHHSGFALVGDANRRDLIVMDPGFRQRFGQGGRLGSPDLHWVVFHPARLRVMLGKFALRDRHNAGVVIKNNGAGRGGALVECDDVTLLCHVILHSLCALRSELQSSLYRRIGFSAPDWRAGKVRVV